MLASLMASRRGVSSERDNPRNQATQAPGLLHRLDPAILGAARERIVNTDSSAHAVWPAGPDGRLFHGLRPRFANILWGLVNTNLWKTYY
jgi:hypothetical protein